MKIANICLEQWKQADFILIQVISINQTYQPTITYKFIEYYTAKKFEIKDSV